MKKNATNYLQGRKNIYEKYFSTFNKTLMLLLFLVFFATTASAQNSCFVTGDAANAPFPTAIIVATTNGASLHYRANPSVLSTYNWILSANSSGASIVGSSTAQSLEVNPGSTAGSFTLTCTVTKKDTGEQNSCVVSVAVFDSSAGGAPTTP